MSQRARNRPRLFENINALKRGEQSKVQGLAQNLAGQILNVHCLCSKHIAEAGRVLHGDAECGGRVPVSFAAVSPNFLALILALGLAGIVLMYLMVLASRVSASRSNSPLAKIIGLLRRLFSPGRNARLEHEMAEAAVSTSPCAFLLIDAEGALAGKFNLPSLFPRLEVSDGSAALGLLSAISADALDFSGAVRRAVAGSRSACTVLAAEEFLEREDRDRYLRLTFCPAPLRGGPACLVRIEDVSEMRELELKSGESREFLRNIIMQAPTSICVFDREGTAILANQSHLDLFRVSDENYVGRYNIFRDRAFREQGLFTEIQRAFNGRVVSVPSMAFGFDEEEGGERIEVRGTLFPLMNAQEEVTNVVMMLHDMTEQRRAENEARYLEEYNRRILASMGAAVRVIDADLGIEYANEYMKKHFDRAPGRPCHDFLEHGKPCEPCLVRQAIGSGRIVAGEFCTPSERWFSYVAAPIKKPDGRVSAVSVIRDITETKRGQQQMIQQEKMSAIGLLASGIAHEINNPLAVISTFAQMLAQKGQSEEEIGRCAEVINRNVENCKRIVQSLLNFSRLGPKQKEAVDINDCARDAFILTSAAVRKAGIELVQRLEARALTIEGDRVQMQQVFVNLIINAVQAMPGGGVLSVATSREISPSGAGSVAVRVSDTGCGMSPEVAARAMEPFFSTKKAERGTGLGLSICKNIVEEHGGKITFTSREGKGTEFAIILPESARAAADAHSLSAAESG